LELHLESNNCIIVIARKKQAKHVRYILEALVNTNPIKIIKVHRRVFSALLQNPKVLTIKVSLRLVA